MTLHKIVVSLYRTKTERNMKAKLTKKETVLVFNSQEKWNEAKEFLLNTNIPFQSTLVLAGSKQYIFINPKLYLGKMLDLYLGHYVSFSRFNVKN